MQEYYKILGLTEDATDAEIEARYKELKEKYSRERFYEGEIGNEAASKLGKVEEAYEEIKEYRNSAKEKNSGLPEFSEIEKLIKDGKINEAQDKLDLFSDRGAEWHYLQSVVFYKKNWTNESKKQLEIAIQMDPDNAKYKDEYEKLKNKMAYTEKQFHSGNASASEGDRQMGGTDASGCVSCCAYYICTDMLCHCCCR